MNRPVAKDHQLTATVRPRDSKPEIAARIARDEAEWKHDLEEKATDGRQRPFHATRLLSFILAVVGLSFAACLWITLRPDYPPDVVKWASSILTAIISGGVGVLVGGKIFPAR